MNSVATIAARTPTESRYWRRWAVVPVMLAGAAVIDPVLWRHGFAFAALLLQQGFSFVCHQRPERSFWISGAPMVVCARCIGIYIGAAAGLLLRGSRRVAIWLLIAAAAMNAIDAGAEMAGLHGNWMLARFALGVALGAAGGLLISSTMDAFVEGNRNLIWIA